MQKVALGGLLVVSFMVQYACAVHEYLEAPDGGWVAAAIDDKACAILAERQIFGLSRKTNAAYLQALNDGKIVKLKSHTPIHVISALFYERGRFVPIHTTTEGDMIQEHIGVVNWLIPKEGIYSGAKICVADGIKYVSAPAL